VGMAVGKGFILFKWQHVVFYNAHACCVAQTHRLLRGKALECILLVGMAVGKGFILLKWQHVLL